MRIPLSFRTGLLSLFVATAAVARDGEPVIRPLLISEHPSDATHRVYVRGQVVTTLRFEKAVDTNRTKLLGWEGRLEPLAVVRNKVVLEPIHDLADDEGIPLIVTLVDGTEVAFLLRHPGWKQSDGADQQVDVFKDPESYASMHAALLRALKENSALTEENERYRKEEVSEDHALAALLASEAIAQTPFKLADRFSGKDDESEVDAQVFQGKGKVAVVFKVKNTHSQKPWSLKSARLVTKDGGHARAVAIRVTTREITLGGSGVVAAVVDNSAFKNEGVLTSLFLELYRQDGLRQAIVQLDPSLLTR
ncbi:DUF2381 family protein [Corallococcus interemptor]|uniref:DUF2381 family protein n=1 Tax=Corallococcus TaxID=83461 RepID=UPI001CBEF8E9|nr:DUF2381 family protein [Corallococcus sp. AS-1-12]MBZ4334904.1 DUF2381 family protein [Corallococcus sp. AS-1-12]